MNRSTTTAALVDEQTIDEELDLTDEVQFWWQRRREDEGHDRSCPCHYSTDMSLRAAVRKLRAYRRRWW